MSGFATISSIFCSSSLSKDRYLIASRLLISCWVEEVPIITEVTRSSFNTHARDICASVWWRFCAISSSFWAASIRSLVKWEGCKNILPFAILLSAGMPWLYFPDSNPCAKGEKQMIPEPAWVAQSKFACFAFWSKMEQRYWLNRQGTLAVCKIA